MYTGFLRENYFHHVNEFFRCLRNQYRKKSSSVSNFFFSSQSQLMMTQYNLIVNFLPCKFSHIFSAISRKESFLTTSPEMEREISAEEKTESIDSAAAVQDQGNILKFNLIYLFITKKKCMFQMSLTVIYRFL